MYLEIYLSNMSTFLMALIFFIHPYMPVFAQDKVTVSFVKKTNYNNTEVGTK